MNLVGGHKHSVHNSTCKEYVFCWMECSVIVNYIKLIKVLSKSSISLSSFYLGYQLIKRVSEISDYSCGCVHLFLLSVLSVFASYILNSDMRYRNI